jgi:hypothetical protein
MPRTGTFTSGNVITGGISGATFTQNATTIDFVREIVFWKGTSTTGAWYYQCVDASSESAQRFSSLTGSAGCTATVPPGGGGTGNAFPTIAISMLGTGGSAAHGTWMCSSLPTIVGNNHIIVTNATPSAGVSADGSFIMMFTNPANGSGDVSGFAFQRCDMSEEGDVDPYVGITPSLSPAIGSGSRTANTATANGTAVLSTTFWISRLSGVSIRGWRRRGFTTVAGTSSNGDAYVDLIATNIAINTFAVGTGTNPIIAAQVWDPETVSTALIPTKVRDPIWIVSPTLFQKMRKGYLRWMFAVAGGVSMDTFNNKQWVQIANCSASVNWAPIVVGPWDGTTQPNII